MRPHECNLQLPMYEQLIFMRFRCQSRQLVLYYNQTKLYTVKTLVVSIQQIKIVQLYINLLSILSCLFLFYMYTFIYLLLLKKRQIIPIDLQTCCFSIMDKYSIELLSILYRFQQGWIVVCAQPMSKPMDRHLGHLLKYDMLNVNTVLFFLLLKYEVCHITIKLKKFQNL